MSQLAVVGSPVTTKWTVVSQSQSLGNVPTDDATAVLKITNPVTNTVSTIGNGSLTRPGATGSYWYTHTPTVPGLWLYRFESAFGVYEMTLEVVQAADSL